MCWWLFQHLNHGIQRIYPCVPGRRKLNETHCPLLWGFRTKHPDWDDDLFKEEISASMLGCALGGYLADWCIEHLTVQEDFQWFQIKVSHFRKIRVFFFSPYSLPWSQAGGPLQACANELGSLYYTKCIFITMNKAGCGGNLIGGFHSKDKMHLSEGNSVVYYGQQGPLSFCHNLPVNITMIHSQIIVTFYHPGYLNRRLPNLGNLHNFKQHPRGQFHFLSQ